MQGKEEKDEKGAPNVEAAEPKAENHKDATANHEDGKEQLLRLAAEFDNYKKRVRKDIESAKMLGAAELATKLLPVLDEFYLANMAAQKSVDKSLAKGVEMLYANFAETLKRQGLEEIKCDGVYDPFMHEIVMTQESEKKAGTILEVLKTGYLFSGVLLRPASVIVAGEKKKGDKGENENGTDEMQK
jgi:molecular chaperone GrpE